MELSVSIFRVREEIEAADSCKKKVLLLCHVVSRDSSVGIATRYGLDGPGIESLCGARFPEPVQTGPGAYPGSSTMGTGSLPGVKRPGRGADPPPTSKCRGQERVGLYLYSPSGPSWPVMGAPLPLPFSATLNEVIPNKAGSTDSSCLYGLEQAKLTCKYSA